MKTIFTLISILLFTFGFNRSFAQDYSFDDFVGTWNGTISSESFEGYNDPITMTIEPDGFYTETSGHLMPTIYPNTQESEFDAETNRYHWWYLQTVYAGQYFYQHFFYEIVYFENDTLEMHYNFWDDPEPHPQVGTIFLVKQTTVGLDEALTFENKEKELIRVVDLMGRERSPKTKGEVLIFQYSDGTSRKKILQ
jgi:hypothetical protein